MTDRIGKLVSIPAIIAAMAAAPALGQDAGASWDTDGEAGISESEFSQGFADSGVFDDWDADDNEALSDREFSGGAYDTFDRDQSGDLDETEYGLANGAEGAAGFWDYDAAVNDREAWDVDGDGTIVSNEFADGWSESGVLEAWDSDGDGGLSEDEFTTGVFERYDEDGSGVIEESELADIGDDMGDEGFWGV